MQNTAEYPGYYHSWNDPTATRLKRKAENDGPKSFNVMATVIAKYKS